MNTAERILWIFEIITGVMAIILAIIYSIPIVFIRRFRNHHNMITLNVCLATLFCGVYWVSYFLKMQFDDTLILSKGLCAFIFVIQMISTIQIPFSIVGVSIHRLCIIIFHTNHFFKTKRWVLICILGQWILGISLSLLTLIDMHSSCYDSYWVHVYRLVMCVIVPSIFCLIINVLIFIHVRSSSRRIQPKSLTTQQHKINRRDIHLLRHIIIMFCIYIGGWTPICLIPVILYQLCYVI